MENTKRKYHRNRAYFFHLLLSLAVGLVLAMHIHLVVIKASGEVFGAGIFLLVMFLAFPIAIILSAVIFSSIMARTDRKIVLLTVLIIILILQWIIEVEPALIISILLEALYVVLTLIIGVCSLFEISREKTH